MHDTDNDGTITLEEYRHVSCVCIFFFFLVKVFKVVLKFAVIRIHSGQASLFVFTICLFAYFHL